MHTNKDKCEGGDFWLDEPVRYFTVSAGELAMPSASSSKKGGDRCTAELHTQAESSEKDGSKRGRSDRWTWNDKFMARRTGKPCLLCGKHDTDQDFCVALSVLWSCCCLKFVVFVCCLVVF